MLRVAVGSLILKESVKHFWRPKASDTKKTLKYHDIEFEKLCLSASMSCLAYKSYQDKSIDFIPFNIGRQNIYNEMIEETQGYALISNRIAFITFKGSESPIDYIGNFDMKQIPLDWIQDKEVQVHQGYNKQFTKIEPQLSYFLMSRFHTYNDIYFIGHSKGGSIAKIAALYYTEMFSKSTTTLIHCISFGAPRTGNLKFAQYYEEKEKLSQRTYRVYHFEDFIAYLPFPLEYCHVNSKSLCLCTSGVRLSLSDTQKKENKLQRIFEMIIAINIFDIFSPHEITTYMGILHDTCMKQKT